METSEELSVTETSEEMKGDWSVAVEVGAGLEERTK